MGCEAAAAGSRPPNGANEMVYVRELVRKFAHFKQG